MPHNTMKKLAPSLLIVASIVTVSVLSDLQTVKFPRKGSPCLPDDEGSWSIGVFHGPSPLNLTPVETSQPRMDSPNSSAWPVSNPIFTCASVTRDSPSNFVADPFLFSHGQRQSHGAGVAGSIATESPPLLHLFFETKSNYVMRGEIGVAESSDGGMTWNYLGIALAEAWHLSYPFVFEWDGEVYMLPEGAGSGGLRLYKSVEFPLHWEFVSEIISRPLIDSTLVQWEGLWYLFGSDPSRPGYKRNAELQIFHAESPLGPWKPHFLNPVMSGDPSAGARMAGRILSNKGHLYRFGQDCEGTYGRGVVAYRIDALSPVDFKQKKVSFRAGKALRRGQMAWNGVRRHHVDAMQLRDGTWLAVMDGDYQESNPLTKPLVRKAFFSVGLWVVFFAHVAWWRPRGDQKGGARSSPASVGMIPTVHRSARGVLSTALRPHPAAHGGRHQPRGTLPGSQGPATFPSGRNRISYNVANPLGPGIFLKTWLRAVTWSAALVWPVSSGPRGTSPPPHCTCRRTFPTSRRMKCGFLPRSCIIFGFIIMLGMMLGVYVVSFIAGESLNPGGSIILDLEVPTAALAVSVDGAYSQFTPVIFSYPSRAKTVNTLLAHYAKCPSTGEVVVVWGRDPGSIDDATPTPAPTFPLQVNGVPVRWRVESDGSPGNRFKADERLRTRAVLSLDDDVIVSCADVEHAFALWRRDPGRIVGFSPRLITPEQKSARAIVDRKGLLRAGKYNAMWTDAAFLDADRAFQLYWAAGEAPAAARAEVDRRLQCEALLMNFLWAIMNRSNNTSTISGLGFDDELIDVGLEAGSSVLYVKPRHRFDLPAAIPRGTGSWGRHTFSKERNDKTDVDQECLEEFTSLFGGLPLHEERFEETTLSTL